MNKWLDGVVGNWQVNLTGRVETGRLIDIGDVKLVNMTLSDLQKEFKYYTNPADGFVYNLPQDLIANTIKAWAIDVTSPTGPSALHRLERRDLRRSGHDQAVHRAGRATRTCTTIITGDCNARQQLIKAPIFSRFDLSVKKRFPFARARQLRLRRSTCSTCSARSTSTRCSRRPTRSSPAATPTA